MQQIGNCNYHFDKIRVNSQKDLDFILDVLPVKEIRRECYSLKIRKPHKKASTIGNRVSLEIVAPSKKALELLRINQWKLRPYYITYLEVTKDTFRESEDQAVSEVKEDRGKLRKRWANSYFVFDPNKQENPKLKKGLYITPTISCGGNTCKYVLYARPSKVNGKPCVHGEWRLQGPSVIKRATGISTITDLFLFDVRNFIESQNERLLRDDLQIDMKKLGKWLEDCTRQKKFSDEKLSEIMFHATAFCSTLEISAFAGLIQYFKAEKKEIKKREEKSRHRRRSDYENRIMKVKNYNRFAKELVDD